MRIVVSLAVVLALAVAGPVHAQEPFKQVWVTQADSGEVIRGRIVQLSDDSLAILTTDNRRVQLPLDRVLRIEARGDSVKNGAIIGASVMGGIGLLGCLGFLRGNGCAGIPVWNAVFGGLMGAGIDAMNTGRTTLYTKPASGKVASVGFKVRF